MTKFIPVFVIFFLMSFQAIAEEEMFLDFDLINAPPTNFVTSFKSDICSAGFPNGYKDYDWSHCCMAHDIAYWIGGSIDLKKASDVELRECVDEAADKSWANVMYLGVTFFGGQHTGLNTANYRWGFGWNYIIGFEDLNSQQMSSIANNISNIPSYFH